MTTALTILPPAAYKVELVEKNNAHYYAINGKDTLLPGYSTIFRKVVAKPALYKWYADMGAAGAAGAAYEEAKKAISDGKWSRSLPQAREAWEAIGAKAPHARRDAAADTGRDLHTDLELLVKGLPLPDRARSDEEKKALDNFLTFWAGAGLRYMASEICVAVPPIEMVQPVKKWAFSDTNPGWPCAPYGGRLDILLSDRANRLILADFKTGSAIDRKKGAPYPEVWIQEGSYKLAAECTYPGLKIDEMAMLHVRHDVPAGKVPHICPDVPAATSAWIKVRGLYDDFRVLEGAA